MVGREKERAELQSGFAPVLNVRGLMLRVTGEPGIGKNHVGRRLPHRACRRRAMQDCAQGYEFDSAVVAQALNLSADEVEERLETPERIHAFVKMTSESEFPNRALPLRYRFVHVLYQNALYASLRATRRATLSGAVAKSLLGFNNPSRYLTIFFNRIVKRAGKLSVRLVLAKE
jgi:predicted ATPase